jgi:hypothetical protein
MVSDLNTWICDVASISFKHFDGGGHTGREDEESIPQASFQLRKANASRDTARMTSQAGN